MPLVQDHQQPDQMQAERWVVAPGRCQFSQASCAACFQAVLILQLVQGLQHGLQSLPQQR